MYSGEWTDLQQVKVWSRESGLEEKIEHMQIYIYMIYYHIYLFDFFKSIYVFVCLCASGWRHNVLYCPNISSIIVKTISQEGIEGISSHFVKTRSAALKDEIITFWRSKVKITVASHNTLFAL